MSKTVHIFDYLAAEANYVPAAVTVVFGEEPFLKRLALRSLRQRVLGDDIAPLDRFDGASAQWRDVHDELSTMALFGGGRRLVLIDDADEFVGPFSGEAGTIRRTLQVAQRAWC